MSPAIWICIFLPLFLLLIMQLQTGKSWKQLRILKIARARKEKRGINMNEALKRFVGKECIITTMSENIIGIIESVEDNWIVVSGSAEMVNADYVSHIKEFPKNKKGKKKAFVD